MSIAEQIKSFHTLPLTEFCKIQEVHIPALEVEAEEKAVEMNVDTDSETTEYVFVDGSVIDVTEGYYVSVHGGK